jgi:hypothetical protein
MIPVVEPSSINRGNVLASLGKAFCEKSTMDWRAGERRLPALLGKTPSKPAASDFVVSTESGVGRGDNN